MVGSGIVVCRGGRGRCWCASMVVIGADCLRRVSLSAVHCALEIYRYGSGCNGVEELEVLDINLLRANFLIGKASARGRLRDTEYFNIHSFPRHSCLTLFSLDHRSIMSVCYLKSTSSPCMSIRKNQMASQEGLLMLDLHLHLNRQ